MPADGSLFGRLAGPIFTDVFCGGGGASLGMSRAFGCEPVVALNHCRHAIEMHTRNHPHTEHYLASVYDVAPLSATRGRAVDLAWFSPDCTDHSRAKSGKPRDSGRRALAWIVVDWARDVRPRVIALENVEEWLGWGPLYPDDYPIEKLRSRRIPERAGEHFREWKAALEALGYVVEWRVLCAADYGAPTTRKRVYLVARCDGRPIVWPAPTHAKAGVLPRWNPAADCIDWNVPVRSIFDRPKPLAEATQARIAEGVRRYVLTNADPFLLTLTHGGRLVPLDRPHPTVTAAHRGETALVAGVLVNTRNGERAGQRPRVRSLRDPAPTVTSEGSQGGLVSAFLTRHFTGVVGRDLREPVPTVTGVDHHSLTAVWLDKLHGSARAGIPITDPHPTIATGGGRGGGHSALCAAFLMRYFGQGGQWSDPRLPMPTVTARENMAVVTVDLFGDTWILSDIGMRMLTPRELARANGFPDSYLLHGSKGDQIERIGNAVVPVMAEVITRANLPELCPAR